MPGNTEQNYRKIKEQNDEEIKSSCVKKEWGNYKQSKEEREKLVTKKTWEKNYNACLHLILGPDEMSESMKIVFKNVCHEPMEQLIYDMVLEGEDEPDTWESIAEKGADLYYIHTKLNQKLERSDYENSEMADWFLLGCIVGEIKERKEDFMVQSEDEMKRAIYRKFLKTDYCLREGKLYREDRDHEHDNFDDYIKFLCKKERNGLLEIHSFNYIWTLLDMRRDNTFEKVRPIQDELYIFCFALALDYDTYNRLRQLLIKEMDGISEEERRLKYRKGFKSFTDSRRDKVLKSYLDNIETRLNCVISDLKGGEEVVLIPGKMLDNVNDQLIKADLRPLTVKTKKGRKLAEKGGERRNGAE